MQRLVTVGLLLMLVLALAVSTGCTNVQKGAAAGGVLGAAIGGPWAHNSGTISTCGGVAIGAATGGLLGALLGDAYDEMKTKEQIAALNDKIAALEKELAEKDKLIAQLRKGHNDVKLTREEFIRLVTWIDANGPFYGTWEGKRHIRFKDEPDFRICPPPGPDCTAWTGKWTGLKKQAPAGTRD